jgi:hypothetical protein
MRLLLALPGLLARPRSSLPPLPVLGLLLQAGGSARLAEGGVAEWLAAHLGVARAHDIPFAAMRRQAEGRDPQDRWWLVADPVTLVAGRDDVRIAGCVDDLAPEEAAGIAGRLDRHFAGDGIGFDFTAPGRGYLFAGRAYAIETTPLARAIGVSLREHLPRGPDAALWRCWGQEIEMLLHADPVNAAREARGLPPVNGLWFSGGGRLPPPPPRGLRRVLCGGDTDLRALALHAGSDVEGAVAGLDAALTAAGTAAELVVVAGAELAPDAVEREFAVAAWNALRSGRIASIVLVADGDGRVASWNIERPGALARWTAPLRGADAGAIIGAIPAAN